MSLYVPGTAAADIFHDTSVAGTKDCADTAVAGNLGDLLKNVRFSKAEGVPNAFIVEPRQFVERLVPVSRVGFNG